MQRSAKDLLLGACVCLRLSVFGFVAKCTQNFCLFALCVTKIGIFEWENQDAPATQKLHNYFKMASHTAWCTLSFCLLAHTLFSLATHIFNAFLFLVGIKKNVFLYIFGIRCTHHSHLANLYNVQLFTYYSQRVVI